MWLLRLLGVLTLIAVGGGFVAYLLTRNPKYLRGFKFEVQLLKTGWVGEMR